MVLAAQRRADQSRADQSSAEQRIDASTVTTCLGRARWGVREAGTGPTNQSTYYLGTESRLAAKHTGAHSVLSLHQRRAVRYLTIPRCQLVLEYPPIRQWGTMVRVMTNRNTFCPSWPFHYLSFFIRRERSEEHGRLSLLLHICFVRSTRREVQLGN